MCGSREERGNKEAKREERELAKRIKAAGMQPCVSTQKTTSHSAVGDAIGVTDAAISSWGAVEECVTSSQFKEIDGAPFSCSDGNQATIERPESAPEIVKEKAPVPMKISFGFKKK